VVGLVIGAVAMAGCKKPTTPANVTSEVKSAPGDVLAKKQVKSSEDSASKSPMAKGAAAKK